MSLFHSTDAARDRADHGDVRRSARWFRERGLLPGVWRWVLLAAVIGATFVAVSKVLRRSPPPPFRSPGPVLPGDMGAGLALKSESARSPDYFSAFVSHRTLVHAHAACVVEMADGRIRAFWYAGTDEGTQDVTIQSAVYERGRRQWSAERTVTGQESTEEALFRYVKKVGNPVAVCTGDGALWLYYVTVSVGGWSGSSITAMVSRDHGETWSRPRRLITSPFFNQSTLVKGPAITFADGSIGLPVYHEFMGKFGELLRLDQSGRVIDKVRLSSGRSTLQPVVLVGGSERALVLMRYAGRVPPKRVMATRTHDGGRSWTAATKTTLSNSNTALTGLVLPDGRILAALNDSEHSRNCLSLALSTDDGATWRMLRHIDDQSGAGPVDLEPAAYASAIERLARASTEAPVDGPGFAESVKRQMRSANGFSFEFSYPSLIRTRDGDYHLVYTWNEAFIKHVQFSQAWLDGLLN
ncbi:MAG: sialidase family protein [Opitutaceae bacterium]